MVWGTISLLSVNADVKPEVFSQMPQIKRVLKLMSSPLGYEGTQPPEHCKGLVLLPYILL